MRLGVLDGGQGLKHRLMLGLAPVVIGAKAPDLLRILFYRPRFFGKPMGLLSHSVMRGQSEWSVGERELFAALVSAKNRCRFCHQAHGAIAVRAMSPEIVSAVLEGGLPQELGPKMSAILPFLEKLTAAPDSVSADDLFGLRSAGISDAAIADAAYVCMLFCAYNRIVDALDCEVMELHQLDVISKMLLQKGYNL
jgi:uncharacterized peroxidase-related enzyme